MKPAKKKCGRLRHNLAQKKKALLWFLPEKTLAEQHLDAERKLLETYDVIGKDPRSHQLVKGSRMLKELVRRQGTREAELARLHHKQTIERIHRDTIDVARSNQRFADKAVRHREKAHNELVRECARFAHTGKKRKRVLTQPSVAARPASRRVQFDVEEFLSAPAPSSACTLSAKLLSNH